VPMGNIRVFSETSCILLYSAIEKYDLRVKVYTPCSSFIDWVENDVVRAQNRADSVFINCGLRSSGL
jgi:uncharacterized ubiquitin-like protein YukD